MATIILQTSTRIVGIGALAEELDVSRTHLWRVINGLRRSDRLSKELAARGITCKQPAPTSKP